MLTKILQRKLKKEGVKEWKNWYKVFKLDVNYPANVTKKQIEIIAHNLALQVVWNKKDTQEKCICTGIHKGKCKSGRID